MSDLPRDLRASLARRYTLTSSEIVRDLRSADGTRKLLLRLEDGETIETVMIPEGPRRTICVSSQVGCPVRCTFCASGIGGVRRNLTVAEIVDQFVHVRRLLPREERITQAVLMGIGEPLLNYENVTRALRILHSPWGMHLGYNKITLSTVGIGDKIPRLLRDGVTPNLAISLHAPTDELRGRIIPAMKRWSVNDLIRIGLEYREKAKKDVTFEYVLLEHLNDEPGHAAELGRRLQGKRAKVNVIPYNRVPEFSFGSPAPTRVDAFVRTLGSFGVFVTVRRRRGDDVSAACGQLRRRVEEGDAAAAPA